MCGAPLSICVCVRVLGSARVSVCSEIRMKFLRLTSFQPAPHVACTPVPPAQEHAGPLLAASAATTVVGRVGADAHWLSDTLAGGGLSLALVSGLAMATAQLAQRQQQQEQGQQGQQGQGQEGQQGQ